MEQDLMVCAQEAWGILPYACTSTDDHGEPASDEDIAAALLGLVDRGWSRSAGWNPGLRRTANPVLSSPTSRELIERLLRLPETWDDPVDQSWVGVVALSRTERWHAEVRDQRAVEG
jgi:hypothetical protein